MNSEAQFRAAAKDQSEAAATASAARTRSSSRSTTTSAASRGAASWATGVGLGLRSNNNGDCLAGALETFPMSGSYAGPKPEKCHNGPSRWAQRWPVHSRHQHELTTTVCEWQSEPVGAPAVLRAVTVGRRAALLVACQQQQLLHVEQQQQLNASAAPTYSMYSNLCAPPSAYPRISRAAPTLAAGHDAQSGRLVGSELTALRSIRTLWGRRSSGPHSSRRRGVDPRATKCERDSSTGCVGVPRVYRRAVDSLAVYDVIILVWDRDVRVAATRLRVPATHGDVPEPPLLILF